MGYSRKIRNAARREWLMGYSYEKVAALIHEQFPDEKPPTHLTLKRWAKEDGWQEDAACIDEILRARTRDQVVDALRAEEEQDIETIQAALAHVRYHFGKKDENGKTIPIAAKSLVALVNAMDRAMRRRRIIRYGFDTITKFEPIQSLLAGADPYASDADGEAGIED